MLLIFKNIFQCCRKEPRNKELIVVIGSGSVCWHSSQLPAHCAADLTTKASSTPRTAALGRTRCSNVMWLQGYLSRGSVTVMEALGAAMCISPGFRPIAFPFRTGLEYFVILSCYSKASSNRPSQPASWKHNVPSIYIEAQWYFLVLFFSIQFLTFSLLSEPGAAVFLQLFVITLRAHSWMAVISSKPFLLVRGIRHSFFFCLWFTSQLPALNFICHFLSTHNCEIHPFLSSPE